MLENIQIFAIMEYFCDKRLEVDFQLTIPVVTSYIHKVAAEILTVLIVLELRSEHCCYVSLSCR